MLARTQTLQYLLGSAVCIGLFIAFITIAAAAPPKVVSPEPSTLIQRAREMGRRFKVKVKSDPPALIAVRIRHEMCPICRSIESAFDPILKLVNDHNILLVTIDLSSEATQRQSALLIASLGLEKLWPADFSGLGSVTLVDGTNKNALASIQTDDIDEIQAFLRETVGATVDAHSAQSQQDAKPTSFRAGASEEIKRFAWMVGTWAISARMMAPDGLVAPTPDSMSTITSALDGCMLRESIEMAAGDMTMKMVGYRSYDQYRKIFRSVWFDNVMGLADVYEGTLGKDGVLVNSNLPGGTSLPSLDDGFMHVRKSLTKESNDKFTIKYEISMDEGDTWRQSGFATYTRQPELQSKP